MEKPKVDEETVEAIVDLASSKCFDWAQGAIAETMGAVAAELAVRAIAIKHETMDAVGRTGVAHGGPQSQ